MMQEQEGGGGDVNGTVKRDVLSIERPIEYDGASKRTRGAAGRSPPTSEFRPAEGMLQLVEQAQKEAIWRELQAIKGRNGELSSQNASLQNDMLSLRHQLAQCQLLWRKLGEVVCLPRGDDSLEDVKEASQVLAAIRSGLAAMGAEGQLDKLELVSTLEGRIAALEEERGRMQGELAEKEERLLSCERQKRRLMMENERQAQKISDPTTQQAEATSGKINKTELSSDTSQERAILAELETLRTLSTQRLVELEKIEAERAQLRYENVRLTERLRRIPEELLNEPRLLRDLQADQGRMRGELATQRKSLQNLEVDLQESNARWRRQIEELEAQLVQGRLEVTDLLHSLENDAARMRKERDQMRALYEQANSQVATCTRQCTQLQGMLDKAKVRCASLEAELQRCRSQSEEYSRLLDMGKEEGDGEGERGTNLDQRLVALTKLNETLRADQEALYGELETIGKAFEDLQGQNTALIRQLTEREEVNGKLLADKLKAEFTLVQLRKETDVAIQRGTTLERASIERLEAAERREQGVRMHVYEMEQRLAQQNLALEGARLRIVELTDGLTELRSKYELLQGRQSEDLLAERTKNYEKALFERNRLQEELAVVQRKLDAYISSPSAPTRDLQEEVDIYRKLMKCNSCHVRDKNSVITRCMHVFCRQCLETRIETRQRKCPNCGESFGASDIRTIYL